MSLDKTKLFFITVSLFSTHLNIFILLYEYWWTEKVNSGYWLVYGKKKKKSVSELKS